MARKSDRSPDREGAIVKVPAALPAPRPCHLNTFATDHIVRASMMAPLLPYFGVIGFGMWAAVLLRLGRS